MAWFKVDDRLWGHPKWLATPARARSLWVTAGSWSAAMETGGKVPTHVLPMLGGRPADASALVTVGLWATRRDGWAFHDWDQFQPDAASLKAKRDAESAGGTFGNHKRWHTDKGLRVEGCRHCEQFEQEVSGTRSGGDQVGESGANRPDPTRPYPRKTPGSPSSSIVTLVTRGGGDVA